MYNTDFASENDLYYDCLRYKVMDDIVKYNEKQKNFKSPYQIILYCMRPLSEKSKEQKTIEEHNILSSHTFEDLHEQKVTTEQLLSWSATIDLVEQYQDYIERLNLPSKSEKFHNCTSPWFGVFCQYTFNLDTTFNNIVTQTFIAKDHDGKLYNEILEITNLTCYTQLECNRGLPPVCLDWREVCDGKIDCRESGVDEMNCFELEMNECENNEYRCKNGMCVSEQFLNDSPYNADCLDSTDEDDYELNTYRLDGFMDCYKDPAFRCEDASHPIGLKIFTCGDGQQVSFERRKVILPDTYTPACRSGRDYLLRFLLLFGSEYENISRDCWLLMSCLIYGRLTSACGILCDGFSCQLPIESRCNVSSYIIFPRVPFFHNHVYLGYWKNRTFFPNQQSLFMQLPDFICYDIRRCPFFSPTFQIGKRTCLDPHRHGLTEFYELVRFFDTCLTVDETENESDCFHHSLFHCTGTSKCISKHRLLDGTVDCYGGVDEIYANSCNLNHPYHFRCSSENKCISRTLIRDGIQQCREGEDEMLPMKNDIYFQNLCNGFTHLSPVLIDEQNETDETNCEQWPCDNQYTRCDDAWTCHNGTDELNCNTSSKCYPDHHECVSPITFEVTCLSVNRTGDGKVDCLGGTDEREYCRLLFPLQASSRYRCWNDTKCSRSGCSALQFCSFEKNTSIKNGCNTNNDVKSIFVSLIKDGILGSNLTLEKNRIHKYKYFTLQYKNRSRMKLSHEVLTKTNSIYTDCNEYASNRQKHSSLIGSNIHTILDTRIYFHQTWICNRGILIYLNTKKTEHCLCPPSYYGDRCQLQSQRVSLTLQFKRDCAPSCRGVFAIIIILVDQDQVIHSYEQLTHNPTLNCDMKYNLYLLYQSRSKNMTKNYTIQVHAYNKFDLTYYMSWDLPIKFRFMPVNRITAQLVISSHAINDFIDCTLACGDHGHCYIFVNTKNEFCRCDIGWSGVQCTIRYGGCDCSSDAICLGVVNNRSICICSNFKFGPRCFLHSICRHDTCKNGGQCIVKDEQWLFNAFTCICQPGYSGETCAVKDTQIDFSFDDVMIPQSLLIYFVTIPTEDDPIVTLFLKKIPFDQDRTVWFTSLLFNMIFTRIQNEYYLSFQQVNATYLSQLSINIKSSHRCSSIDELFDNRTLRFPLLRRAKYYHVACRKRLEMSCLYDLEQFMCLCNEDRFANCFNFDFTKTFKCQGHSTCGNNGQCLQDLPSCAASTMCTCNECHYGGTCELTTKGFGLSLDTILGYQIRRHLSILRQPAAVKVSIAVTTLLLLIGLINGTLSSMTFNSKEACEVGCGFYLLTLSILSCVSATILTVKLWLLIGTQILWITNHTIIAINCVSVDFILRSLAAVENWLSACVALERTFVVIQGIHFNKDKSKQLARRIIFIVILLSITSVIQDPIHRQSFNDREEERTWCIVSYSLKLRIFDSIVHIFHLLIPFSINLISAIVIIINTARVRSNSRKQQNYQQYLRKQFYKQKHLIISPIILIILAVPHLIISFLSGCMKPGRDPWVFLFGYFISFLSPILMPMIFIFPSKIYRKQLHIVVRRITNSI